VSVIGSLEQFNLSNILQRIEEYKKTGLLIVKQGKKSVELSFRQGQLMCIGPIKVNRTLGDRLLQAGVISQKAFQEVTYALGTAQLSETRSAIILIDLGYVNQESLYTWAAKEASCVLQVLLSWSTGEIYFEEGMQPPADRLLISLSVSSLLPRQRVANRVRNTEALSPSQVQLSSIQRVVEPLAPRPIDTSFMQPQMVLIPTDLSGLRERNPRIQLTPEQWRLFTLADGQTSLQKACQLLEMPRELVCQLAGELIAFGLVTISMPTSGSVNEPSPITQGFVNTGLSNSYAMAANDNGSNFSTTAPIETLSQWGNGGNGATFVLGGGWVVASSPSQPLQSSGPLNLSDKMYAQAGGVR